MIVTNSDKNSVIVATRFFAQRHQMNLSAKVHSSAACIKKAELKQYILK